jgi:hypothetical protein
MDGQTALSFAYHLNCLAVISTARRNLGVLGMCKGLRFLALLGMTSRVAHGLTYLECTVIPAWTTAKDGGSAAGIGACVACRDPGHRDVNACHPWLLAFPAGMTGLDVGWVRHGCRNPTLLLLAQFNL